MDDVVKEVEHQEKAMTSLLADLVDVDWLELPEQLTYHILSKLTCTCDYARVSAVCVQWRNIALEAYKNNYTKSLLPPHLPLLMIPTPLENLKKKKKKRGTSVSCSFYRVTDGKIYNGLQITFPRDRYVRGSGHGWLITVDNEDVFELDFHVQLLNPFFYPNTATKEIKLPPLTAHPNQKRDPVFAYYHLRKAVLSADPVLNPKDFIVMSIFGGFTTLAFWKPGDKAWTSMIDNILTWDPFKTKLQGCFDDIIYYKGEFYALHDQGTILVCNVANRTTTTFAEPPVTEFVSFKKYLIVSAGELYQVHKAFNNDGYTTYTHGFKVFKLQRREPDTDWVEVKNLYDHAFFVGDNTSMSISASDFPRCKPNCIYHTDDNEEVYRSNTGPHDMGVFNLENDSFEQHYPTNKNIQIWPAPIWVEPTLPRSITHCKRLSRRHGSV